ncbi:DNA repair protein RAD51 homolog 2 isoform X2 [Pyrus x bretschneideri]|uniref:DNA repair protein RAD51 homolog 2 isoform X2 n=1 Tax=Pyrus x bretschneideri TaxID=225117 RepID=UPI0020305B9C|nr:DNA repair protein RAD51 homolog 2 isoform X2 [Pyrus x bretschneideri]
MANKLINQMGLPKSIANVFTARNITTAKVLDVNLAEVTSAIARISEITCPPYQTVLSLMEQQVQKEHNGGHLSTRLKGLDDALCGGIPFGVLTELVGPAGIGKTQFCLKLALLASLPEAYGGLDGRVIYIDVESKFSSRRMIEIGSKSFPEIFHKKGMAQEMAGRILVMRPTSLSEFTESLQQLKISLLQNHVKLLIIDSMAALVAGEQGQGAPKQHLLGWHISFIKSLAEFSRIPIVVTNQVRSQIRDEACQYSFQGGIVWSNCEIHHMNYECNISYSAVQNREKALHEHTEYDSHLVAALGIHWAHAVTIRLVLDSKSGKRFIKLAKSPISPPLAFAFNITSSGISLLSDGGIELTGPEINTIHCQGHSDVINFDGKRFQ